MGWAIVGVIAVLLILDVGLHLCCVIWILPFFEIRPPFGVEPSFPDPEAEPIRIATTHGLTLQGSLYRHHDQPALGLVIFCHEFGGNRWSARAYCEALWQAGFDLLAFDFRNHGESDALPDYRPMHWLTEFEVNDVLAAIDYVRQQPDLRQLPLGLVGVSRGGCAALAAAARCQDVRAIACDGAYSTHSLMVHYWNRWASLYMAPWILQLWPLWHLKISLALVRFASQLRQNCRYTHLERSLARLRKKPVLLIAGECDSYAPPEITQSVYNQAGLNADEMWIVPRAKHNMARQVDCEGYDRRLVSFFLDTLAACRTPAETEAISVRK